MSSEPVPAQIKILDLPQGRKNTLVFSINDVFVNTHIIKSKNEIIHEFESLVMKSNHCLTISPLQLLRKHYGPLVGK